MQNIFPPLNSPYMNHLTNDSYWKVDVNPSELQYVVVQVIAKS